MTKHNWIEDDSEMLDSAISILEAGLSVTEGRPERERLKFALSVAIMNTIWLRHGREEPSRDPPFYFSRSIHGSTEHVAYLRFDSVDMDSYPVLVGYDGAEKRFLEADASGIFNHTLSGTLEQVLFGNIQRITARQAAMLLDVDEDEEITEH